MLAAVALGLGVALGVDVELGTGVRVGVGTAVIIGVGVAIGPLSQLVHMWAYEDLADREARRAKLAADPAWAPFLERALPLLDRMENKILRPVPFFTPPELK